MAQRFGLACLIIFTPILINTEMGNGWVVWNVGQGQWVTKVEVNHCLHFDMGGETVDWARIAAVCRSKINRIYLSHWDWDHISFIRRFHHRVASLCMASAPQSPISASKRFLIAGLKLCPRDNDRWRSSIERWRPLIAKTANAESGVFKNERILIPGDSTKKEEQQWGRHFKNLAEVRILVLGHHGSKTSTSAQLLSRMPNLNLTIASARQKKYGHPHAEVTSRLKNLGVPLLRTEDWGNIWIHQ